MTRFSNRRLALFLAGLWMIMLVPCPGWSFQKVKFEHSYSSKTSVDSTRKDYYDLTYDDVTYDPIGTPNSFDKSFVSSINDLSLSFKGDLTETQILDVKETLHYQKYRPEDYDSSALDTYKYTYLDHWFQMTYGLTLGKQDAVQTDYINSIYRIPQDELNEYVSHLGKLRFNHKVNDNTSLSFEGDYEARDYINDDTSDYWEGAFIAELSRFFPEKIQYQPISRTSRGSRQTFENTPNGMSAQKAVDYYTNWTAKPNDPDTQAKYIPKVVRGDLYLTLTGDFRRRRRPNIDYEYQQPLGTLKATYEVNDQVKLTVEDTYYQRRFDTESDYYYLYDHRSNKASLSGTYQPDRKFTHILSASNEFYEHDSHTDQDYVLNTFTWETYYSAARHSASFYAKDAFTRYGQPRLYYPDSDQLQAIVSYDFSLTQTWVFHLKDEWLDYDYKENEDLFYSSYVRNTWKVALEKYLDKRNSLELGYQNKREKHRNFFQNDIVEKTLYLTWNASL